MTNFADLMPRIATALVLVVIGGAAVWAAGPWFAALIAVVCGIMVWELARMIGADQKRALALARDGPPGNAACAGFFVGKQLPGWHVTRGVRRVTYLDPDRGVGAFIWTKSQVPGTFSCAHEQE